MVWSHLLITSCEQMKPKANVCKEEPKKCQKNFCLGFYKTSYLLPDVYSQLRAKYMIRNLNISSNMSKNMRAYLNEHKMLMLFFFPLQVTQDTSFVIRKYLRWWRGLFISRTSLKTPMFFMHSPITLTELWMRALSVSEHTHPCTHLI